jgi:(1->4)-alpha-D-glucan 1-alpha-D-glucosylmutase
LLSADTRSRRPLACTYRVQFHAGFTFRDAAAQAGYLEELGVTHLYCSPYLQAETGSTHGYDVVDHRRINPELGGEEGHAQLAATLAEHGLSQVLDIVANHMATDGRANRWWWDVLENGPRSRYASYFDIDWVSPAGEGPRKVLVPILGDHLGRVLEAGELRVTREANTFLLRYYGHELPLSPDTVTDLAAAADPEAALAGLNGDVDALDALLVRQHYWLAHWRTANEELNYRRFANIQSLVGLRVEDEEVFDRTHELVLGLVAGGVADGLRVDHVDGLRDPQGYLERLARRADGAWVVVEKVLEADERIPAAWPAAGTTGYDFLNRVNRLFVDGASEEALTAAWQSFAGLLKPYDDIAREAKRQIMREELEAEVGGLAGLLATVCERHRRHHDDTRRQLREVLGEVLATFPVYRTYVYPGRPVTDADRSAVATALGEVGARRDDLDPELLRLLGEVLLLEHDGAAETELALRFQQVSAPVMAKGEEDTAFYRYHRLVSLNDVGGDPGRFGEPAAAFHAWCREVAEYSPGTMLTLSTHDTKRSADVRARLNVLSEVPAAWTEAVAHWRDLAHRHRRDGSPDRADEYLLYQTLVGAWPIGPDRAATFMEKATKEAKVHTSWTDPQREYDEAVQTFTYGVLGDRELVAAIERFLDEQSIVAAGRVNSLAQTALLLTCPGVPDLYQGTEVWDLSLVDPDNRRPIDFERRRRLLGDLGAAGPADALARMDDGGPKLWLVHRLLDHRRRNPDGYAVGADHRPLDVEGTKGEHTVAFARADDLVVVVPRLPAGIGGDWGDTSVAMPSGRWLNVLCGAEVRDGRQRVADLLSRFPVAILARER